MSGIDPNLNLRAFVSAILRDVDGTMPDVEEATVELAEVVRRLILSGWRFSSADGTLYIDKAVFANLSISDLTANNALHVNGKTEGSLSVNNALFANVATYAYGGKAENTLNVNAALFANSSTYLGSKLEAALSVAQAANASLLNNKAESALSVDNAAKLGGKLEAALNVNSATTALTANNATNAFGKSESQLNANSATNAGNADMLNGQVASFYRDAGNLNAGTVPTARLGSGVANSTTFLAGDQTYKTVSGGTPDPANTTANGLMTFVDQSFAGVKTFTENVAVSKALSVTGNSAFTGNATFTSNVVSGNTLHNGTLFANGATTVNGTLLTQGATTVNNTLTVNGTLLIQGATNQNNNITVNGFANVLSTLRVAGLANLVGNATFSGFANVGTTLQVTGLSTLTGNATFAGFINVQTSTLQVGGTTLLVGNTSITANLTVSANMQASHIGCNVAPHGNAVAAFAGQYYSPLLDKANTTATMTIDWNNGNEQYANVNASVTFTFSNPVDGGRYVLLLKTGTSLTATWPATVLWANGAAPTLTATSGKYDLFTFLYLATPNKYIGTYAQNC